MAARPPPDQLAWWGHNDADRVVHLAAGANLLTELSHSIDYCSASDSGLRPGSWVFWDSASRVG